MNECSSNLEFTMSMMIGLREDEAGTHDDTATKVLRKLKHGFRHCQPFRSASQHWEESATKGGAEDNEDGGDTETTEGL